jgi:hypothetical protein
MKLREYRVEFFPASADGNTRNGLQYPENLGLKSKLGGEPDWIQGDDVPVCPECSELMTFVAQLDSIEHDSPTNPHRVELFSGKEKHFMSEDVGMIYVFFCFDCGETKSVFQSY